jgi:CelD/BcsL family acetyltransferase involved in cellulose biosynthesis
MDWAFAPAEHRFAEFRPLWDSLNSSRGNHLLLDSDFVEPLIRYFGSAKLLIGIGEDSDRAMILVHPIAPGAWATFQPSQAPMGMVLFGGDERGERLRSLLKSLPGYALQLSILHQDPDYSAWPHSVASADVEVLDYIDTPRLAINSTFDEYWKTRSTDLRNNLARRRRRLAESGRRPEWVVLRRQDEVSAGIAEYGRLESQGWKSQTGTAISEVNAQGKFYTDVMERFCSRGEGFIFQFLLDGVVVATDLCLVRNRMMVVLKTTYDESLKSLSPGLMMREEQLRWLWSQGQVEAVEFYGRAMDWHRKFTDDSRTMYHLNCYRSSWVPILKKALRRFQ